MIRGLGYQGISGPLLLGKFILSGVNCKGLYHVSLGTQSSQRRSGWCELDSVGCRCDVGSSRETSEVSCYFFLLQNQLIEHIMCWSTDETAQSFALVKIYGHKGIFFSESCLLYFFFSSCDALLYEAVKDIVGERVGLNSIPMPVFAVSKWPFFAVLMMRPFIMSTCISSIAPFLGGYMYAVICRVFLFFWHLATDTIIS